MNTVYLSWFRFEVSTGNIILLEKLLEKYLAAKRETDLGGKSGTNVKNTSILVLL